MKIPFNSLLKCIKFVLFFLVDSQLTKMWMLTGLFRTGKSVIFWPAKPLVLGVA